MTGRPAGTRVGWGCDVHRLGGDPPLKLGGVVISESDGVIATSDGDVLAHAITDALLGAASLGDVGEHFPSDDPAMDKVDSMFLLRQAATMAMAEGWVVTHVDATVVAQEVRVAPRRDAIRAEVAGALGLKEQSVSIKATTTDGLGFIGSGDGLAAIAVVTVTALS